MLLWHKVWQDAWFRATFEPCKYMAFQLADPVLLDDVRCVPNLACLRAHFILNEAQLVVSAFCCQASSTATKSAATANTIPITTFSVAVSMVAKFQSEVMGLFWHDLTGTLLPLTYSKEFPPSLLKPCLSPLVQCRLNRAVTLQLLQRRLLSKAKAPLRRPIA